MSALTRNPRSQRAKPILVQEGLPQELVDQLAEGLEPAGARVVGTLFDAVCDAGQALVGAPVSAVLMGPPPASITERDVVEAFRRTDPSVRLVRLFAANEANNVEGMINAGFDDALPIPVSASRLMQAVGGPMTPVVVNEPVPAGATTTESKPTNSPSEHDASSTKTSSMPSIVEVVLEDAWARLNQEELPTQPTIAASSSKAHASAAGTDADLVRAVLKGDDIEQLAIDLIRQHTGINGVQFRLENPSDRAEASPHEDHETEATRLEVPAAEGLIGYLTSPNHGDEETLETWVDWLSSWLLLQNQYTQFRHMALFDHLTGAGNRHALFLVLDRVIERARRDRRHLTVMYFDIDNFKTYNDRFGHDAGDQVLCETVHLLNSVIRRGDHVFRMGGDEFVVVFADPSGPRSARSSPPESIEQIVERFQQQVGTLQLPQIGLDAPGTLSISAGMVAYPWDGRTAQELLQRADQLALESKRSGKNGIIYGPAARNLHRR